MLSDTSGVPVSNIQFTAALPALVPQQPENEFSVISLTSWESGNGGALPSQPQDGGSASKTAVPAAQDISSSSTQGGNADDQAAALDSASAIGRKLAHLVVVKDGFLEVRDNQRDSVSQDESSRHLMRYRTSSRAIRGGRYRLSRSRPSDKQASAAAAGSTFGLYRNCGLKKSGDSAIMQPKFKSKAEFNKSSSGNDTQSHHLPLEGVALKINNTASRPAARLTGGGNRRLQQLLLGGVAREVSNAVSSPAPRLTDDANARLHQLLLGGVSRDISNTVESPAPRFTGGSNRRLHQLLQPRSADSAPLASAASPFDWFRGNLSAILNSTQEFLNATQQFQPLSAAGGNGAALASAASPFDWFRDSLGALTNGNQALEGVQTLRRQATGLEALVLMKDVAPQQVISALASSRVDSIDSAAGAARISGSFLNDSLVETAVRYQLQGDQLKGAFVQGITITKPLPDHLLVASSADLSDSLDYPMGPFAAALATGNAALVSGQEWPLGAAAAGGDFSASSTPGIDVPAAAVVAAPSITTLSSNVDLSVVIPAVVGAVGGLVMVAAIVGAVWRYRRGSHAHQAEGKTGKEAGPRSGDKKPTAHPTDGWQSFRRLPGPPDQPPSGASTPSTEPSPSPRMRTGASTRQSTDLTPLQMSAAAAAAPAAAPDAEAARANFWQHKFMPALQQARLLNVPGPHHLSQMQEVEDPATPSSITTWTSMSTTPAGSRRASSWDYYGN